MRVLAVSLLASFLVSIELAAPASATTIEYQARNLADITVGADLWEYSYRVADHTFTADSGFSVFFDPALYASLEDPPPAVNSDWDPISLQPDPALPDDGLYDALALVDAASLADLFRVNFVWLGAPGTAPGAQPFEINQYDSTGVLVETLESGVTVPEPSVLLLALVGMIACLVERKRCFR